MTSGVVCRLKCRSRSSEAIPPSIPHRALLRGRGRQGEAAVRRRSRPLRQAALALRPGGRHRGGRRRGAAAADPGAPLRLPARQPRAHLLLRGLRGLARGAPPGGAGRLLRDRRRLWRGAREREPQAVLRPADAAAHARARRAARTALPGAQDPRGRAVPSLSVHPIDELRAAVEAAAGALRNGGPALKAKPSFERPKKAGFGDYSTNAAMLLAPALGAPPREIAQRLGERLSERLGAAVDHVEVAGPGFLNVFLADAWYVESAHQVLADERWGHLVPAPPQRVHGAYGSAHPP